MIFMSAHDVEAPVIGDDSVDHGSAEHARAARVIGPLKAGATGIGRGSLAWRYRAVKPGVGRRAGTENVPALCFRVR